MVKTQDNQSQCEQRRFSSQFCISREEKEAVREKAKDMFAELDDSGDGEVSQVKLRQFPALHTICHPGTGGVYSGLHERRGVTEDVVRKLNSRIRLFKLLFLFVSQNCQIEKKNSNINNISFIINYANI